MEVALSTEEEEPEPVFSMDAKPVKGCTSNPTIITN
jgi:hypothetical protein